MMRRASAVVFTVWHDNYRLRVICENSGTTTVANSAFFSALTVEPMNKEYILKCASISSLVTLNQLCLKWRVFMLNSIIMSLVH
jgi:hypothetical protein